MCSVSLFENRQFYAMSQSTVYTISYISYRVNSYLSGIIYMSGAGCWDEGAQSCRFHSDSDWFAQAFYFYSCLRQLAIVRI